ncbi:putative high-glucose-regulated protein [Handroanthus impetiginosus]|uniref:YTH domain-containing family protein n=1 Tax=Handroanthus impetiginosus TaxID=429701 RepID=A0A2G9GS83_9LAMI|nr:putative high-glucose-regulated protein [Handroanthus impetiginosus]
MSGDKKIQTSELSGPDVVPDSSIKFPGKDMGGESASSVSGITGATDPPLASEQSVYYPPTGYDYYYPVGYNSTYALSDDKGYINTTGGSFTGNQPDNTSLLYYVPGYASYTTGPETFPYYTYNMTFAGNGSTATSGKSNGYNTAKTNNNLSSKTSASTFNSKNQLPASPFFGSIYQNQSLNPSNKRGYYPALRPGIFPEYNSLGIFDRASNNNYRYKSRENSGRGGAMTELTRGPRADNRNNSSKLQSEVEQAAFAVKRDKYNLQEFKTEYDSAKFYVIKSYSEDDIHKCIKYDVWSSTPNGNRKLDAAFREADTKTNETGIKCPIFLFFSVNGSGQFVGVAEMTGQVDFSKNMDFWQLDKWNGFFPIKWHIIKDVPNMQLRHIILENNENRPVTYSRDTQEIGLKQGLEMLSIFKSYSEKTSVLDDFNFYENREKTLKVKRNAKPASQTNSIKRGDEKRSEAGEGKVAAQSEKANQPDPSSLVSLTENLSLNSQSLKSSI